ncbi:MAG: hypothetical protein RHS_4372 [Robinsoniella sp. RHS]|nr:MAG: hypothetical protein RHS_4372 [Robinsoniella sp. RHS]
MKISNIYRKDDDEDSTFILSVCLGNTDIYLIINEIYSEPVVVEVR